MNWLCQWWSLKRCRDIFFLLTLITCIAQGTSAGSASTSPLQATDLVSLVQISNWPLTPVVISPDGARVAYVLAAPQADERNENTVDSRGTGRLELWVQSFSGGVPIRVGPPQLDNWAPSWSPDGKRLSFYSGVGEQADVAVWDVMTNTLKGISIVVNSSAPVIQWLPDGTHMLVPQEVSGAVGSSNILPTRVPTVIPPPVVTVLTSSRNQNGPSTGDFVSRQPYDKDQARSAVNLALVDATTDAITPIARDVNPTWYRLSPDGTKLLYTLDKGMINSDVNDRVIFDIMVVDLRSGSTITAARDILTSYSSNTVTWSHDGSKIAFVGGTLRDDAGVPSGSYNGSSFPGSCYIIDLHRPGTLHRIGSQQFHRFQGQLFWSKDDSTIYLVTADNTRLLEVSLLNGISKQLIHLRNAAFYRWSMPPAFLEAGNRIYAFVLTDDGETQVWKLDLNFGYSKIIFRTFQRISQWTFSRDGMHTTFVGEDVSHPQDVWTAGADFAHTNQLTHLNPQIEARQLSRAEEGVSWRSREGVAGNGVLLLPTNYRRGKRYPTILFVYAGERFGSESRGTFGLSMGMRTPQIPYYNLQLFASRGYAVFVPNSTLHIGNPMRDIANAILPGMDKIVAMGIADPKRLGVWGQSYGGYSTMSLIVQTNRFKAAVVTSGVVDLISEYATLYPDGSDWTAYTESEQGRIGGTPWQYRDRYIENSPFFYLDRVQTPVLLEYGSADGFANVNMPEAFVALRRLGKEATLLGYAGEDHTLTKTSNQIDFTNRMLDWFQKYLRPDQ